MTHKGAKRQLPVCHLCGREFGTASIKIHQVECAKRYEREKGKPAPPAPDLLNQLTSGDRPISSKDWEAYNEAAQTVHEGEMEPCPLCGRTFSAKDRLAIHLRSCDGSRPIGRAKTDRGTAPPRSASPPPPRSASPRPPSARPAKPSTARAQPLPAPTAAPEEGMASLSLRSQGKAPAIPPPTSGGKSAKERMVELKELLDAGLINQGEFEGKRAQILASI